MGEDASASACVQGYETVPGLIELIENVGLAKMSAGSGVRSAACELVLEALVSQKRIARSSAGYTRTPYQNPKTEEDYQGFDDPGDVTI